ncbi:MAG: hypothetical protein GY736_22815 [Sphingomonas sp.]|uniref:hypothetical protein n=1 Tax=Sphingomonas sp. TaxID=28214 RepID=UPI0025866227|nr:hypothetical protein [Sphingomonas sp.]MCP4029127.1 hypothetical protein [Sphingomonas sp.]
MTDFLRFLMTPTDRDRIAAGSVTVTETPFDPAPATAADPRPESIRLQFRISDPANGAPQLKMIFPGKMRFEPDAPVAPQVMPSVGNVPMTGNNVDQAQFDNDTWPTRGKLRVQATERDVTRGMDRDNKYDGIGLTARVAWFEPVVMTRDFINSALLNGLGQQTYTLNSGTPSQVQMTPATAGWAENTFVRFYEGRYQPLLTIDRSTPVNRTLDDVIRFPMPLFPMTAAGDVDIRITLGATRSATDIRDFNMPNPLALPLHHPGHPNMETLPTRVFFQKNRTQMIGADAGNAIVDAIIGTLSHPRDMKARLEEFGFGDLGPANNTFNDRAHMAVREFQIYTKMATVATESAGATGEWSGRLNAQANPSPYTGPIHGFLNTATRERIDIWARPANRLRCPVVVSARTGSPGYAGLHAGGENIWVHNDVANNGPRMFVRDVSGHYALPAAADARDVTIGGNRYIVLGYYDVGGTGGPNMLRNNHSWATMGLDSDRLVGVDQATLFAGGNAAMLSTYMTVLPTVEKEASSRFDVVNAWDAGATISLPLFHYTFHSGELGGLFAYLESRIAANFGSGITFFGLKQADAWASVSRFQAKRTSPMRQIRAPGGAMKNVPQNQADENYFKSWHWFYRMVMANRIYDDWKLNAYNYARWRLADVMATTITQQPGTNGATAPVTAAGAAPTIAQVFTSERSMAMVLRWHVNRPAHINTNTTGAAANNVPGHAGAHLWGALERAQDPMQNGGLNLNWINAVNTWTDDYETALMAGLIAEAATLTNAAGNPDMGVRDNILDIRDMFTVNGRRPDPARDSFDFDPPP